MSPSLAPTIQDRLARYLAGELSLDAFYDWLVAETWDIEQRQDPAGEELSYAIKLAVAEHSSGYVPTHELRRQLVGLINEPVPEMSSRS